MKIFVLLYNSGTDKEGIHSIELTPEEALSGTSILIELEDQTFVEVDTPPFAGDGWRLRLENIARGGKDHYLQ